MANEGMKISQKGRDLIAEFEGLRLTAYQDSVGVWTIGYGHTKGVYPGQTITVGQANAFLDQDISTHATGIFKYIVVKLNQNQFDALVSFHFNLGPHILSGSNLLTYINNQQWQQATTEMKRYVYAGGQVLNGLVRRRNAEVALFLSGDSTNQNKGEKIIMFIYWKKNKSTGGFDAFFVFNNTRMHIPNEIVLRECRDLLSRYNGSKNEQQYNYDNFGVRVLEKTTSVVSF